MADQYKRCEELHAEAMRWANDGFASRHLGKTNEACAAFLKAWGLERDAAMELISEALEPSRSILFRSAASLALLCGEVRSARALAPLGLAGDPSIRVRESLRAILADAEARVQAKATFVDSVSAELRQLQPDADLPEPTDATWKRSA
jgi:hypothetical protein